MPDASGVAHATGGNHDVKTGQPCDPLTFLNSLREVKPWGTEQAANVDGGIEA